MRYKSLPLSVRTGGPATQPPQASPSRPQPSRLRDTLATIPIVLLLPALILPLLVTSANGAAVHAPNSAHAGQLIDISGTGFPPRTHVQTLWNQSADGMPVGRTDASGAFSVSLQVPMGVAEGQHEIAAAPRKGNGPPTTKTALMAEALASTTIEIVASTAITEPTTPPTPAPTAVAEPSVTPTPVPTVAQTATPAPTAVVSPTPAPTAAVSPTPAPTASPTPAPTATASPPPAPTATASAAPGCTTVVAAGGSIQGAIDAAASGTTICLRGGTYSGFSLTKSGLTVTSYPGETATVRGQSLVKGVSGAAVRGLVLTGATGSFQAGLRVEASSGVVVAGNRMAGNILGLFLLNARGVLVEENVVTDNAYGIEVHRATEGTIIRNNRIDENDRYLDPSRSAGGMNLYYTSGGITVSGNTFYGNNEVAVEIYAASDILLSGNRMTGSSELIETGTENGVPCNNIRIIRNVGWNGTIGSGAEERGFYLRCASNSLVAHNVLDGMDQFAFGLYTGGGSFAGSIEGLRLLNNIAVNGRPYSIDSAMPASVVIDYNLVTTASGPANGTLIAYVAGQGSTTNWDQFRSWTGYDTNGMNVDPLFVDRAGRDYRLADGSPAIDRALVLTGYNDGFTGSGPDVGRFER